MTNTLLIAGLACLIGAIVGGGLKAFGLEIPVFQSTSRQLLLGVLGVILVAMSSVGIGSGGSSSTIPTTNRRQLAPANSPAAYGNSVPAPAGETPLSVQTVCPNAATATTQTTFDWGPAPYYGSGSFGLSACVNNGNTIDCSFVLSIDSGSNVDWDYRTQNQPNHFFPSKLFDNLHIEHDHMRGYFLNGRCEPQPTVNVFAGDKIWVIQEFDGATPDITTAKVVFYTGSGTFSLKAPVNNAGFPSNLRTSGGS